MNEFDWEKAYGSPQRVLWLKANHEKEVSLDEFIVAHKNLRQYSLSRNGETRRRNYQLSNLKRQYNNLQGVFGFFHGS